MIKESLFCRLSKLFLIFAFLILCILNCAPASQVGFAKRTVQKFSPALVKIIFLGATYDRATGKQTKDTVGGTGVFITEDGFILTADHIVGEGKVGSWPPPDTGIVHGFEGIWVEVSSGRWKMAGMVTTPDKSLGNDLTLLLLGGDTIYTNWPHLEIDERDDFSLGEPVVVMGYPSMSQGLTVSEGIVTNINPNRAEFGMSALVTPGSSGGPVITADGKIIGIANANRLVWEKGRPWGFAMKGVNVALRKTRIDELMREQRKNWKK